MKLTGKKHHTFVLSDTAASRLCWVDADGKIVRTMDGIFACFDLWQNDRGELLVSHFGGEQGDGFTLFDRDGRTVGGYRGAGGEVFSVQPLPDGNFLTAELRHKALREVSAEGQVLREIPIAYEGANPHEAMRMARKTADGYLVVQPGINRLKRLDLNGMVLDAYPIRPDAFGVVELPDGHLLYTCMSGAYELDRAGHEVWSLTAADVPEIGIRWLLGVALLPDGNLVFSNWMGHGHRDEGVMFFEVDREKHVMWSADGRGELLEPAVLQLTDIPFSDVRK